MFLARVSYFAFATFLLYIFQKKAEKVWHVLCLGVVLFSIIPPMLNKPINWIWMWDK